MTLFEQMEKKDPKRNPVFTAIDTLKDPEDIKTFVMEYEEYLIQNTNDSIRGRERETARSNVGYILGYYSKETRAFWYQNLPDVNHPVFGSGFGRGKDVTTQEAYNAGKAMGEKFKNTEG
jgi:hypothetical protein